MRTLLWLDDIRDPLKDNWLAFSPIDLNGPCEIIWVKKYHEFVDWIGKNGLPTAICFDHDLSDIHIKKSTYKEKTGMDCAKWLVEYCLDKNLELPKYNIQSANPVGKDNINSLLKGYKKHYENSIK